MNKIKAALLLFLTTQINAEEWVFEKIIDEKTSLENYSAYIMKDNLEDYISVFCNQEDKEAILIFSTNSNKSQKEINRFNIYFDNLSEFNLKAYYSEKSLYITPDSFNGKEINNAYSFLNLYNELKYNNYLVIESINENEEIEKQTFNLKNSKNSLEELINYCNNH